MDSLEAVRRHWTDALAAFGAHIEIHMLPEWEDYRGDERPVRVVVVGRSRVSGPVLVEIDENREKIVQAFTAPLSVEDSGAAA